MSGIDEPGAPPEVPEEYAAVYRDAYLRALQEEPELTADAESAPEPGDPLTPLAPVGERMSWVIPVLIGVAVLVLIVVVATLGLSSGGGSKPSSHQDPATLVPTPTPRPSRHPSHTRSAHVSETASASPAGPTTGVVPSAVTASCTAPPGVDSSNKKVDYAAANTVDGDASTAWRCDGGAIGTTLTFTLPAGTEVAQVGLIPGYDKTDPVSGVDRYAENNRITRVRWTLADGVSVEQDLDPGVRDRSMQTIAVPPTSTGSITLQVLAVKKGPRNTTAISEVEVSASP